MTEAEDFTPIRVSTLRGDIQIPFDVYIRVAGKFIHYCRKGTSFEGERLERLKSKRLRKMFIRPEDELPYKQYLEESIDGAYRQSDKPLSVRAEVIQGFQEAAAEDFMDDPLNQTTYQHVRSSAQRFVEFLQEETWGAQSILRIRNIDQSVSHHSVNVATLATSMTLANNMRDPKVLQIMALGCLFHDIDHHTNGLNLLQSIDKFSTDDHQTYRNHPKAGAHRLQGATFLDQLVVKIILEHEEHSDGTGFPKGLFEKDMDPLVLIAATANAFDRLTSFENMSIKEALKHMLIQKLGAYPLTYLQSLQNLLKNQQLLL